jgi:hypothetical protein
MSIEKYLTIEQAALELANVTVNDNDIRESMSSIGIPETEFSKLRMAAIESRQKFFIDRLNDARKQGYIAVRDLHTKLPYTPKIERDFYEVMSLHDINVFLKNNGADYRLDTLDETSRFSKQESEFVGLQVQQEHEILRIIKDELGFDPFNLPALEKGKAGVKSAVRKKLNIRSRLFKSMDVFNKAWQRMLDNGLISYQKK